MNYRDFEFEKFAARATVLLIAFCFVALMWFYAALLWIADNDTQKHSVAAPVVRCVEDDPCWNPLINGNHRGTIPVFPAQPFRVLSSTPQRTTGK